MTFEEGHHFFRPLFLVKNFPHQPQRRVELYLFVAQISVFQADHGNPRFGRQLVGMRTGKRRHFEDHLRLRRKPGNQFGIVFAAKLAEKRQTGKLRMSQSIRARGFARRRIVAFLDGIHRDHAIVRLKVGQQPQGAGAGANDPFRRGGHGYGTPKAVGHRHFRAAGRRRAQYERRKERKIFRSNFHCAILRSFAAHGTQTFRPSARVSRRVTMTFSPQTEQFSES